MPNARRTIRWTILQIKHTVPFFQNECPIFNKKLRKLICTPDIIIPDSSSHIEVRNDTLFIIAHA